MNPTLIRNIVSPAILGFVLVIGFQATALEATASSFSSAAESCEHDCLLAQADCRDWCDDEFFPIRNAEEQEAWEDCRDDCIDDYDECILDCEPQS